MYFFGAGGESPASEPLQTATFSSEKHGWLRHPSLKIIFCPPQETVSVVVCRVGFTGCGRQRKFGRVLEGLRRAPQAHGEVADSGSAS